MLHEDAINRQITLKASCSLCQVKSNLNAPKLSFLLNIFIYHHQHSRQYKPLVFMSLFLMLFLNFCLFYLLGVNDPENHGNFISRFISTNPSKVTYAAMNYKKENVIILFCSLSAMFSH
jgi:hypothetical protein